jgi:hypothetical protein
MDRDAPRSVAEQDDRAVDFLVRNARSRMGQMGPWVTGANLTERSAQLIGLLEKPSSRLFLVAVDVTLSARSYRAVSTTATCGMAQVYGRVLCSGLTARLRRLSSAL